MKGDIESTPQAPKILTHFDIPRSAIKKEAKVGVLNKFEHIELVENLFYIDNSRSITFEEEGGSKAMTFGNEDRQSLKKPLQSGPFDLANSIQSENMNKS